MEQVWISAPYTQAHSKNKVVTLNSNMYVGSKAYMDICAIRGLPCAKRGSVLCASHPRIDPRLRNPGIAHA